MGPKHLTTYRNKPSVFDRIESGEISEDEKNSIMDEFEKHLNSPYGTLENYPKRYVVEALLKKYETVADPREIRQFIRLKIGRVLNKILQLAEDNRKIHVQPALLQMLLNHMSGADNVNIMANPIIENHIIIGNMVQAPLQEVREDIFS